VRDSRLLEPAAPKISPDEGAQHMRRFIIAFVDDTRGQDLIEYALLAGFISLAAVTMIINVGTGVNGVWGGVDAQMQAIP